MISEHWNFKLHPFHSPLVLALTFKLHPFHWLTLGLLPSTRLQAPQQRRGGRVLRGHGNLAQPAWRCRALNLKDLGSLCNWKLPSCKKKFEFISKNWSFPNPKKKHRASQRNFMRMPTARSEEVKPSTSEPLTSLVLWGSGQYQWQIHRKK